MEVTAIILAGGKSSRMGREKGLAGFNGKPLVQSAIDVCKQITSEIFISTGNADYSRFGFPLIPDNFREHGPIGGIEAGLTAAKTSGILVCPCDMPGISLEILKRILHQTEGKRAVVAASVQGKVFPVLGWYSKTALSVVQKQIEKGDFKLMALLNELQAETVVVADDEALLNINYPHDLK
ncbi:molybdenum cofactor guanylyltransferase [Mariniphaga sp.]|uniref:molybdenum cofactor guanylyltransferase n=1 Tax=Mariniphaga sp. TaxID=1954475 RepID=UPI003562AD28